MKVNALEGGLEMFKIISHTIICVLYLMCGGIALAGELNFDPNSIPSYQNPPQRSDARVSVQMIEESEDFIRIQCTINDFYTDELRINDQIYYRIRC